jgi:hypothetical protein
MGLRSSEWLINSWFVHQFTFFSLIVLDKENDFGRMLGAISLVIGWLIYLFDFGIFPSHFYNFQNNIT